MNLSLVLEGSPVFLQPDSIHPEMNAFNNYLRNFLATITAIAAAPKRAIEDGSGIGVGGMMPACAVKEIRDKPIMVKNKPI